MNKYEKEFRIEIIKTAKSHDNIMKFIWVTMFLSCMPALIMWITLVHELCFLKGIRPNFIPVDRFTLVITSMVAIISVIFLMYNRHKLLLEYIAINANLNRAINESRLKFNDDGTSKI